MPSVDDEDDALKSGSNAGIEVVYHVHKIHLATGPRKSLYFKSLFDSTNQSLEEVQTSTTYVELDEFAADMFPVLLDTIYNNTEMRSSITRLEKLVALRYLCDYFDVEPTYKIATADLCRWIMADNSIQNNNGAAANPKAPFHDQDVTEFIYMVYQRALFYHDEFISDLCLEKIAKHYTVVHEAFKSRFQERMDMKKIADARGDSANKGTAPNEGDRNARANADDVQNEMLSVERAANETAARDDSNDDGDRDGREKVDGDKNGDGSAGPSTTPTLIRMIIDSLSPDQKIRLYQNAFENVQKDLVTYSCRNFERLPKTDESTKVFIEASDGGWYCQIKGMEQYKPSLYFKRNEKYIRVSSTKFPGCAIGNDNEGSFVMFSDNSVSPIFYFVEE